MSKKKPHPETCERCPNRYSEAGCPCWVTPQAGFVEKNVQGEERFITGCYYQVMPRLMTYVLEAANRPAAAMEEVRNNIEKYQEQESQNTSRVVNALKRIAEATTELPPPTELKQIEATSEEQDRS